MIFLVQTRSQDNSHWSDVASFVEVYPACKYAEQCVQNFTIYESMRVVDTRSQEVLFTINSDRVL